MSASTTSKLGVGLIGAHTWADKAHLPGYKAHERVDLIAVCDLDADRARAMGEKYGARKVFTDPEKLIADPDVQMVDVCTPTHTHLPLSLAAIAAGKHVLSEKPLHTEAAPAFDAAARADAKGVRTKLGFTFRYSPAIRQIKKWIDDGTLGEIFHIHGFEQNSQWLDPQEPLRQITPGVDRNSLIPASIVGYGSHLIDLMRWLGGEFGSVASTMKNFIPERIVRGEVGLQKIKVEDGAVALVEYASGAQGLLQTSYVAVGNYPGVEIRVYGSKGAAVARLISEFGTAETLKIAKAEAVEFIPYDVGAEALPPGTTLNTPWPELYYRNLVRHFVDEILEDRPQECTFFDGAKSQEIVDAIIKAHFERRWVDLPGVGA
ncbi:oxidoreductase [Youhaiella tibetensis]|uniref:Gfo/Idh/MocA family oxidoreductase n=1 Tax=Paradevosia tibetensis TaxID=1447062 RepID=A0A5B9DLM1_9HYPH|nr:Gfo/Idh/MocA family oxidoreductase [Youhaiella tibetensis]QEE19765.1 Gfo/Idh/MocA family oxidoreductase [Youhaiella tibetensis]GGF30172.1 oxidoreductase [Youhaiella tibetensis]